MRQCHLQVTERHDNRQSATAKGPWARCSICFFRQVSSSAADGVHFLRIEREIRCHEIEAFDVDAVSAMTSDPTGNVVG